MYFFVNWKKTVKKRNKSLLFCYIKIIDTFYVTTYNIWQSWTHSQEVSNKIEVNLPDFTSLLFLQVFACC